MSRHPSLSLAMSIALALGALPAFAATPINETRPLDPRGRIEIENIKGSIDVQAWDRAEVKIEGSLGAGVEKLEIEGDRDHLAVRVKYPNRGNGLNMFGRNDKSEPTDLKLMVPRRADLSIDSVAADVGVTGVASGDLSIDSVSGDVTVAAAPGEATIDSVSGDLQLTINSSKVSIESVSGDIFLRGRLDGDIDLDSVSGNVDVAVHESRLRKLNGSTVSGDMSIGGALAKGGQIALDTVSGDLRLNLPKDLSATVRGESFSGDLSAPGAQIDRPRHGPGSSFEHRYGSGDGEIRIETFSGNARLGLE
ncbi:DUF4097 family beta strand repeat-containing protein [Lysobacter niastensis]|uniref:DUF4097 family beta strand repeat protein n=1 Tax=Lysobacter niastensis TaxID=380629 RepID=A0ABS0B243_9GAMM|nr:DUF4097 family beta strand repeat-containing protein [Lysobacter niastensis]MBF6022556.1 DUF4097 family beta strand repeat protein [Lysobacter niastensis]